MGVCNEEMKNGTKSKTEYRCVIEKSGMMRIQRVGVGKSSELAYLKLTNQSNGSGVGE